MDVLEQLIQDFKIPKMAKVRQHFPRPRIEKEDIPAVIREELQKDGTLNRIKKGDKVAITAGSRGIANIALI
ncbi:MAG: hypothetical protein PWP27_2629, partial [Clostridiales bacterium]|nr:hypothetical protein [Clostridiales bacterium]